ncbi:MAG: hypothetical protein CVV64_05895 [Candidatus Wallbacteria bacterium HGW-Wallbacteria-1]|jgi:hypothetical protein|uniref:Uncharacterized protein n=1 Tax=Candidatus Wallbacteria bacterium HGW-Wallbacteria-1 TaxID=2013854 RepID=A0A2N1PSH9_9BACT|nr:MAG: hypothetical protein CVV64_05895 [Candidatus Wallbacteria bacterium HGW-Wallbacteria-1]
MIMDYQKAWEKVLDRIDSYLESTEPMSTGNLSEFQDAMAEFTESVKVNPMISMVRDSLDDFVIQHSRIIELLIKERKKYGMD